MEGTSGSAASKTGGKYDSERNNKPPKAGGAGADRIAVKDALNKK